MVVRICALRPVSTGMGDRLRAGISPWYITKPTRSTQPCIPPGSLNRVPALTGWCKGGNVTSTGWQLTPCDPTWRVSSPIAVRLVASCYIRLLYLLYTVQFLQANNSGYARVGSGRQWRRWTGSQWRRTSSVAWRRRHRDVVAAQRRQPPTTSSEPRAREAGTCASSWGWSAHTQHILALLPTGGVSARPLTTENVKQQGFR